MVDHNVKFNSKNKLHSIFLKKMNKHNWKLLFLITEKQKFNSKSRNLEENFSNIERIIKYLHNHWRKIINSRTSWILVFNLFCFITKSLLRSFSVLPIAKRCVDRRSGREFLYDLVSHPQKNRRAIER